MDHLVNILEKYKQVSKIIDACSLRTKLFYWKNKIVINAIHYLRQAIMGLLLLPFGIAICSWKTFYWLLQTR